MKALYTRPYHITLYELLFLVIISLVGIVVVEVLPKYVPSPTQSKMIKAAELANVYFAEVKRARINKGIPIDPTADPTNSGLIGEHKTSVTSAPGSLSAKQTTINPNFAAVIVHMLDQAGVKENDVVAASFSGSFPALNICVIAAARAMNVKLVVISSIAASQWGANHPDFLWIDMEHALLKLVDFHSAAASIGGWHDRGLELPQEGVSLIREKISQSGLLLIEEPTYEKSVEYRTKIYNDYAGESRIDAYINVGGAAVSVGKIQDKLAFEPGLSIGLPERGTIRDSVMSRFAKRDIPIIHLSQIHVLAKKYKLPWAPSTMPEVGKGEIYRSRVNVRFVAGSVLIILVGALFIVVVRSRRKTSFDRFTRDDGLGF